MTHHDKASSRLPESVRYTLIDRIDQAVSPDGPLHWMSLDQWASVLSVLFPEDYPACIQPNQSQLIEMADQRKRLKSVQKYGTHDEIREESIRYYSLLVRHYFDLPRKSYHPE